MDLNEINEKLEEQLKNSLGIQLDQLPKEAQDILEELADFQVTTNLCDIDSNLIREWYIVKRKANLDLKLKCLPIKSDIASVKSSIAEEEKLIAVYEKVLEELKSQKDASTVETELHQLQKLCIGLKEKHRKILTEKHEVNLKELAEKMQRLK